MTLKFRTLATSYHLLNWRRPKGEHIWRMGIRSCVSDMLSLRCLLDIQKAGQHVNLGVTGIKMILKQCKWISLPKEIL